MFAQDLWWWSFSLYSDRSMLVITQLLWVSEIYNVSEFNKHRKNIYEFICIHYVYTQRIYSSHTDRLDLIFATVQSECMWLRSLSDMHNQNLSFMLYVQRAVQITASMQNHAISRQGLLHKYRRKHIHVNMFIYTYNTELQQKQRWWWWSVIERAWSLCLMSKSQERRALAVCRCAVRARKSVCMWMWVLSMECPYTFMPIVFIHTQAYTHQHNFIVST